MSGGTVVGDAGQNAFDSADDHVEGLTREERVLLLAVAAVALLRGDAMPTEAAKLLGVALARWLTEGGDLDRLLGVRSERGSRRTPANVLRWIEQGRVVVPVDCAEPCEVAEIRRIVLSSR